jgi:hypothetical protein
LKKTEKNLVVTKKSITFAPAFEKNEVSSCWRKRSPENLKKRFLTRAKLLTLDKMKIHFLLFSLNRSLALGLYI